MLKSTIVNRAPVMMAWACVVAERLGFSREEALSIGIYLTSLPLPLFIYPAVHSVGIHGNERDQ